MPSRPSASSRASANGAPADTAGRRRGDDASHGIHPTAAGFVRGLPRVWRGRNLGGHKTYERVTRHARLIPDDGPMRYMLDGDIYEQPGPLDVSIGPRIRIVVP